MRQSHGIRRGLYLRMIQDGKELIAMIKKDKKLFDEMDLIARDEFVRCKCLACGHEQKIPSWLIAEISEMNEECGLDDHFSSACYKCEDGEVVTMDYYNKVKNREQ